MQILPKQIINLTSWFVSLLLTYAMFINVRILYLLVQITALDTVDALKAYRSILNAHTKTDCTLLILFWLLLTFKIIQYLGFPNDDARVNVP